MMAKPSKKSKSPTDLTIDAIIAAAHGDPFAFLGMQEVGSDIVIRTLQPGAIAVTVLDGITGKTVAELPRLRQEGFFAGPVGQAKRFPYRLKVDYGNGYNETKEDPYRFPPVLGDLDVHLLGEGTHLSLYRRLGAHVMTMDGVPGVAFAVWAPNARRVSVVGDFNRLGWTDPSDAPAHRRRRLGDLSSRRRTGTRSTSTKSRRRDGRLLPAKADPYGYAAEQPPKTASVVYDLKAYAWAMPRGWNVGSRSSRAMRRSASTKFTSVHGSAGPRRAIGR